MRAVALILLGSGALLIAISVVESSVVAEDPWYINDTAVLEDETLELHSSIVVRSDALLELRGSTLVFNNTEGSRNGIIVEVGGSLVIARSNGSRAPEIITTDIAQPTFIRVMGGDVVHIEGLRMRGGYPAVHIEYSVAPVLRDCQFVDCIIAVEIVYCKDVIISDNRIDNITFAAFELVSVQNPTIVNNSINECRYGLRMYTISGGLMMGNTIKAGMWCVYLGYGEDIVISDTTFIANGTGCFIGSSNRITVRDSVFVAATQGEGVIGLVAENAPFTSVIGCRFEGLMEAIRIAQLEGFSPTFCLVHDCAIDGCGIGVRVTSSNNTISRTTIEGASVGIAILNSTMSLPGGNGVVGCSLDSCDTGILVQGADQTILSSNRYTRCVSDVETRGPIQLYARDDHHESWEVRAVLSRGSTLEVVGCSFEGTSAALMAEDGGAVWVRQSSISVDATSVIVNSGSFMVIVNSTHTRRYDVDATARLDVIWDVYVSVRFESGSMASTPGWLQVHDVDDAVVQDTHITVPTNRVKLEITTVIIEGGEEHDRTPHDFTASAMDRGGGAVVHIDSYEELVLVLDDIPPTFEIFSPEADATNRTSVRFIGTAHDGGGSPVTVQVILDGQEAYDGIDVWDFDATLEEGEHNLVYNAIDAQGNRAERRTALLVDSLPPVLFIEHPNGNRLNTTAGSLEILGHVVDGKRLTINGETVSLVLGRFRVTYVLATDGIHTFAIEAFDALENCAVVTITVNRDTEPPSLTLDELPRRTRNATLRLSGTTDDPLATIDIDSIQVHVGVSGEFTGEVELVEGENGITVRAMDPLGNSRTVTVQVTSDTRMLLRILSPRNGTILQVDLVEVLMEVEPGASIRMVDGPWCQVGGDGFYRQNITLDGYITQLQIEGVDELGNTASMELVLYLSPPVVVEQYSISWPLVMVILLIIVVGPLVIVRLHSQR